MTPPTADTDDHGSHSRRAFLATTASLGLASLSGCVYGSGIGAVDDGSNSTNSTNSTENTPSGLDPTQYADQFKHQVNIAKKGADNTGKQAIDDVLEQVIDNDTLVYFPPGRYKLNTSHRHVGLRNLGIIGQNAVLTHGRVDAIEGFDVTKGEYHGPAQHFKIGVPDTPHKGRFVFGGFTVDWRGKNEGMQILNHHTAGKSVIQNIRQVGMHSLGCQGPFRLNPATENAFIRARNIDIRHGGLTYQKTINTRDTYDGGPYAGRSWATSGITMHPRTQGKLRLERVICGGWPDNGIYVIGGHPGTGDGTVEVISCIAGNSQASNIRIGGTDSKIIGCKVIIDQSFGNKFYYEQRPIRLDDGSCTVKNTQIIQKKPTGWSLTVLHGVQKALIENVSIAIHETPTKALVVDDAANNVTVRNMQVQTPGWQATKNMLFRGSGDVMENITVDGKPV